jgi:L-lactate dehydrogenase complex protein LldG
MSRAATTSLVDSFEQHAREAAAIVEHCPAKPAAVRAALQAVVQGAQRIVLAASEFVSPKLVAALLDLPGLISNPADEQLANAEVGITGAFAGVASSGSVCIALGPPLVGAASLLMPLHIVLLDAARILPRPRDLFDPAVLGGEGLRRNLVFVTGPSATADMGPLVRGVHGPHRLHILILE